MSVTFNFMMNGRSSNGDSAGYLINTPQILGPVLTFVIGIILTISVFSLVRNWEQSELQSLFEFSARSRLAAIQADIIRHQEVVNSIVGLFSSSQHVTHKEFRSFVQGPLSRQPSIQGLSWNPLISNSERKRYTEKAHEEGFSDFQITELDASGQRVKAPTRDDYVVVYYIEPYSGNEQAMGFNIASHPGRLAAIQQTRDTGKAIITERIRLVQERGDSFGYLLFMAIYDTGDIPSSLTERREHFAGVAAGVFRFNDWIPFTMQEMPPIGMDVLILDQSAPMDKQFLYFQPSRTRNEVFQPTPEDVDKAENGLHWRASIEVLGRKWSFLFTPAPVFLEEQQSWQAWAVLVAGLSFSLLLTLYLVAKIRYATSMAGTNVELVREITERKAMDVALRESEKRYRTLVDSSPDWVWETDAKGVYTYASPKVYELLGYRPEEVLGKTPFDLMTPTDAERTADVFAEIVADKRSFHNLENANRHKNGQLVVLETSGVPILAESGELLGYRGVDRDITQRIINEAELKAQRDFTDTVLDAASNVIVVLDLDGRFVRFNRVAEELTGYTSEQVLGKPLWELFILDEQHSAVKAVFNNLRNSEAEITSQYENEWLTRDGGRCLLQWHNSVLRDDNGKISHIVAVGYDITEKKKAEAEHQRLQRELQQAHKMDSLGQLTGGIAHDFNNLLGIINGYANLMLDNYRIKKDQIMEKYVGHIVDAGDRAARLVAQMLAFSRSDQEGDMPIPFEPLLKEDIMMLRATLPSTIEIRTEIEPALPDVLMNPIHLHQILMNLSINARDAMQGVGQLSIKLGWARDLDTESPISHKPVRGDWIELSVSDTGCGIDVEMANYIFNPFFTTKEVGKGTGMGLSVIYGIMESHEGHILLESQPGKGSTFRMLFCPVFGSNGERMPGNQNLVGLPEGDGSEILLVDDEVSLGNLMTEFLMNHGYQALYVSDSTDALALFQGEPDRFPMLITDQTMPGMTGTELINKLRQIRPELPVILCTGYSDKVNAREAAMIGVSFLEKPVSNRELLLKISELLNVHN